MTITSGFLNRQSLVQRACQHPLHSSPTRDGNEEFKHSSELICGYMFTTRYCIHPAASDGTHLMILTQHHLSSPTTSPRPPREYPTRHQTPRIFCGATYTVLNSSVRLDEIGTGEVHTGLSPQQTVRQTFTKVQLDAASIFTIDARPTNSLTGAGKEMCK